MPESFHLQLIDFMMSPIDEGSKSKLIRLAGKKKTRLDQATRALMEYQIEKHKVQILFLPFPFGNLGPYPLIRRSSLRLLSKVLW